MALPKSLFGEKRFRDDATLIHTPAALAERLPPINDAPWPTDKGGQPVSVPSSYCLIGVEQILTKGQFAGMPAVEHGGGTLIHPRVVLTDAHVVCSVVDNGFSAPFSNITVSLAPPSRAHQPLRYACNTIMVANVYEADRSRYRGDLALIILPEAAPLEYVAPIENMVFHQAEVGELCEAVGMGLRSDDSNELHDVLQRVPLECVERRKHLTRWKTVDGRVLEKGFSGGGTYDADERNAWFGPFSHYVDGEDGQRIHSITDAKVALGWGLETWHRFEADSQTGENLHSGYDLTPRIA